MRIPFIRNKFFMFMTFLKYLFSGLGDIGKHLFPPTRVGTKAF